MNQWRGDQLKRLMKAARLSNVAFGLRVGLSPRGVGRYRCGATPIADNPGRWATFAKALGVSFDTFMAELDLPAK
jgi:transcriptional regulator with XRE-family HTH domain